MAEDGSAQSASIWPLPKFHFQVKWDDTELAFQEVSGLDIETEPLEYRAGNNPVFSTSKMPGMIKTSNITMKKGVFAKDNAIFDWFNEIKLNTIERKTVQIMLLNENGDSEIIWTLTNAFPKQIQGTDLNSQSSDVAVETLVLAHEGLAITTA